MSYGGASLRREPGPGITGACPRDVPEPPPTANDRHQQQPANMKPARPSSPRPTPENTLVMCSSMVVSRPRAPRWRQPSCATADDVPVESAFRITGRGTVVMGVIDQGTLHIGDHLEVIQPGSA